MSPSKEESPGLRNRLASLVGSKKQDRIRFAEIAIAIAAGFLATAFFASGATVSRASLDPIETGRVADKDLVADRKITYVDEKATLLRIEAEERLVLPIFDVDEKSAQGALERLRSFQEILLELADARTAPDTLFLKVQSEFPGLFAKPDILDLSHFPLRSQVFTDADAVLRRILDRGIVSFPSIGLEHFNGDYVEIRRFRGGRLESDEVPVSRVATLANIGQSIDEESGLRRLTRPESGFVSFVVRSFTVENAFFNAEQSDRRLETARKRVDPVERVISPGERIIRKGSIITEADHARVLAAREALSRPEWGRLLGDTGVFLILTILCLLLLAPQVSGAILTIGETALAAGGLLFVYVLGLIAVRYIALPSPAHLGAILPVALLAMTFSVFAGQRFAYLYGLTLGLFVLLATDFDARIFSFVVVSAIASAWTMRRAESRIDLVRAGTLLAVLLAAAALVIDLSSGDTLSDIAEFSLWAGINGLLSSFLALVLFPVLEQALNAPTRFRLIELSDLNAPMMKRLLAVAPGTYSHSVTVAQLAESACRDISADPILARVGAYYHDIGKVEQPEYFVENQTGYNKHDEINPRLSATVIRSHVKLGVEKARSLGLPKEVIDIVAEHHGNGIISWFYDRAARDEDVDPEDFSYPGPIPATREAAVVMLADAVEAASRALKKPTPARLDSLIKEIMLDRIRHGQLERCDLTFRDLETIRSSFTRILAGHFHSRIEYPRQKEGAR